MNAIISETLMSERVFDYSNFPDASAPRRFEVLNAENTVCGYGIEMSSGFCLAEQPDSPDQSEWREHDNE
jgi:hypothetical protein